VRDVTAKTSGAGGMTPIAAKAIRRPGGLFGSVVPVTPVSSPRESPSSEKISHPIGQSSIVDGGLMLMAAGL
jgi:hypothetical protein